MDAGTAEREAKMNGYNKYTIPCSLLDIQGLEKFFEKKAEKGNLIRDFSKNTNVGRFEEVQKGKYHFCIDIYRKNICKSDESDPEFSAYIDECESVGWTYTCTYKNLVIFYSKDEERPLELKRNQIAAKQYLHDITRMEEKKILAYQVLWPFLVVSVCLIVLCWGFLKDGTSKNMDIWICSMFFVTGLTAANISGTIAKYIQNIRIGKALETGKEHLLKPAFWDDDMVMSMALLITGFVLFLCSYQMLAIKSAILASCAVIISAVLLCLGRIRYRIGKKCQYSSAVRVCSIVPIILLSLSLGLIPSMGSYRYQIRSGRFGYSQTDQEEAVKELGLRPEMIGWGETDFTFLHKNQNPLCSYEYLIYQVQNFNLSLENSSDYEKTLRYIGTAAAKIKNEKVLQSYLKQKDINLKRSYSFELLPDVSSYIEENGKAQIHIKGDLVVIFFVNEYDERSFDIIDLGKLEVYRENLEKILRNEKLMH